MGQEQAIGIHPVGEPHRVPLTVRDFLLLEDAGAFEGLGRVELIDGEVFTVAPLYYPHGDTLFELTMALGLAVREVEGFRATTPVSAELDANSLPEPDLLVVKDGVGDRFVTPEYAQIFIEVSASSLRHDLGRKLRLYARSGVPEYWVADVKGGRIIRFHAPAGEEYAERATFAFGDLVPSATIPGLTVDTARLA